VLTHVRHGTTERSKTAPVKVKLIRVRRSLHTIKYTGSIASATRNVGECPRYYLDRLWHLVPDSRNPHLVFTHRACGLALRRMSAFLSGYAATDFYLCEGLCRIRTHAISCGVLLAIFSRDNLLVSQAVAAC
jgi:hypothetical protein